MKNKIFFLGEYGFAYRQFLPFLEKCEDSLEIVAWKAMCDLIDLLWPNKHTLIYGESIIKEIKPENRRCTFYLGEDEVKNLGYTHVSNLNKDMFNDSIYKLSNLIDKKITFGVQCSEKPYVSVFFRNRNHRLEKNNKDFIKYLDWVKKTYPDKKIIGHGLSGERMDVQIDFCRNVFEQINAFNNSICFVTGDSGIIDLSLMCGCDLVLINKMFDGYIEYKKFLEKTNPQNCNINYFEDLIK